MDHLSLGLGAHAPWIPLVALVFGVTLAVWSYRHTVPQTTAGRRRTLMALRSIGLAALLFAILEPVLTATHTDRRSPSIAVVLDDSRSMRLPERGHVLGAPGEDRRTAMLRTLRSVLPASMLTDTTAIELYRVSEQTEALRSADRIDSLRSTGQRTDLSSLFDVIRSARKTRNTEAIVLFSDGAFTAGRDPIYPAADLGLPVYAVGMGDSSEPRDVALTELFTNAIATVGASQPVDLTLHYGGAHAGEHLSLELFEEDQRIGERTIELTQARGDLAITLPYTPKTEGVRKLTARVSKLEGEATDRNNVQVSYVTVLKNRFHVVLFAGAPSSDVSFLEQYFGANPSVRLSTYIQKHGAEFYEGTPSIEAIGAVDLVVMVGFPVASTSEATLTLVRDLLTARGGHSSLFVASRQLDLTKLQRLSEALPFRVDPRSVAGNELHAGLAVRSAMTEDPVLRIPPAERSSLSWDGLAPLFKTETHFEARPESRTLADVSATGVTLREPLLLTRQIGRTRQVAITGYGLWQWKLASFGRERAFRGLTDTTAKLSALERFLSNATRWLTTEDDHKRVQIHTAHPLYQAGERIDVVGQVYDESFQPIEHAEVTVEIQDAAHGRPIALTLEDDGNGRYHATLAEGLPKGDYSVSGRATQRGNILGTDDNRFNVGDYDIELSEPRMRADLLTQMAERTGGRFYTPETAGSLLRDLRADPRFSPQEITSSRDHELWNSWPLLTLAILAFGAEWFLRKRLGML